MPQLDCSETQFAFTFFAKFNQFFNYAFSDVIAPSTIMEGNDNYEYNGADLVLDSFFFQFKMSELLNRVDARELVNYGNPTIPYFRFGVKNLPAAGQEDRGQLDYLIDHSRDPDKKVYYVSPSFDKDIYSPSIRRTNYWHRAFYRSVPANLDNFCSFLSVRSLQHEDITSTDDHVICYKHGANEGYFCSDPKVIVQDLKGKLFFDFEIGETPALKYKTLAAVLVELEGDLANRGVDNELDNNNQGLSRLQVFQKRLIEVYNVFWVPIILPFANLRDRQIGQIIKVKI